MERKLCKINWCRVQTLLSWSCWHEKWSGKCVCEQLKDSVFTDERKCDIVIRSRLEIEGEVLNTASCYVSQTGSTEEERAAYWEQMDNMMQTVPRSDIGLLVGAGDMNGHVEKDRAENDDVNGGHPIGSITEEGMKVIDMATAHELSILNTIF